MASVKQTATAIGLIVPAALGAGCGSRDVETLPPPAAPTETSVASSSTTLPGDPFDPVHTPTGSEVGAVGVRFDETLALHVLPGTSEPVVATLPPLATGIVTTGRARLLDIGDAWLEVTASGSTGWAPMPNLLYVGGRPRDATARFESLLGGTSRAPTMLALGRIVAEATASDDPEVRSRVVPVVAPTDGPLGEVTYDVVGFADDSIGGVRLLVTGRRLLDDELPPTRFAATTVYELVSVESTALCLRGATADGLCV
jgi:hypothetical protein